ncbi:MAG: UDP-glucose/GDP-mannose dehydrogenase family protein [Pseudomonadota bacterium]
MSMDITIIGTGYVGLVSGACLAALGHNVICVDKDQRKIDMLHDGDIPIYEPGLADLVQKNVRDGRLGFSMDVTTSCKNRDAVFIAVGTPTAPGSDTADLHYVRAAVQEVARAVTGFTVIVTKSTVPVGTNADMFQVAMSELPMHADIAVASNPEFLREGAAIDDFMQPDRIVVGTEDERAARVMRNIYAPLTEPMLAGGAGAPLLETGLETAELIKYAANAFLAVKISYINEIANLCERVGADVDQVADGMGMDARIGRAFLNTGPGWGGSCFPKDTRALAATAQQHGSHVAIVNAAIAVNDARKDDMVERIVAACGGSVAGKTIGVLGLTFKGQTDDMREATSLVVLPELVRMGARVKAYDPSMRVPGHHEANDLLPQIIMSDTPQDAARLADVLVVMTDWQEFKAYDLTTFARCMRRPMMVDLRNLMDGEAALDAGFTAYHGLGRPPLKADAHAPVAVGALPGE